MRAFAVILCALPYLLGLSSVEQSATVTASAYNSTAAQTDDNPNEGAWGDEITPGMKVLAVSPDLLEAGLERGTEVRIEGLRGTWTVLDRTASRHRNRIDIYLGNDVDAAIAWGLKKVTIHWNPSTP
jgi:3D (Asp-Asp-Asp) domain-containing protein